VTAPLAPALPDTAPCPCDLGSGEGARRGALYSACCGRWHSPWAREAQAGTSDPAGGSEGGAAPDAAALMRSRYSAYVLGLVGYLRATWAPETCPADLASDEGAAPVGLKWLGLEVRRHAVQGADRATVEFVARSKLGGRAQRLHEISRFERRHGRWLYVDGEIR
jgi:SEC-C motif domain protein